MTAGLAEHTVLLGLLGDLCVRQAEAGDLLVEVTQRVLAVKRADDAELRDKVAQYCVKTRRLNLAAGKVLMATEPERSPYHARGG